MLLFRCDVFRVRRVHVLKPVVIAAERPSFPTAFHAHHNAHVRNVLVACVRIKSRFAAVRKHNFVNVPSQGILKQHVRHVRLDTRGKSDIPSGQSLRETLPAQHITRNTSSYTKRQQRAHGPQQTCERLMPWWHAG